MYYLNEKEFKPLFVFLTVIFAPPIIALSVVLFWGFNTYILVVLLFLSLIYVLFLLFARKNSQKKDNYLVVQNGLLEIHFPNIAEGEGVLNIETCDVIKIVYYKITSLRGWVQLLGYVSPKCAYITYKKGDKTICELFGFFDLKDIESITSKNNIILEVR